MQVKVILLENYPQLGYVGDLVTVKRGFARNFLEPRGIAAPVRARQSNVVKHIMRGVEAKKSRLKSEAQSLSDQLGNVELNFTLKMGTQDKSFGSVTARDIENGLIEKGFDIRRRQIRLPEPLRTTGKFRVDIRLHSEVLAPISVIVAAEAPPPKVEAVDEGEGGAKRGGRRRRKDTAEEAPAAEATEE